MGSDAPAYLYFGEVVQLPPGAWLVHFTKADFASFDRGTTLEGLALSTWKRSKDEVDCERNLSGELGPFEIVYGFAYDPEGSGNWADRARGYGYSVLFFQTDCAVSAWHWGDQEQQVIFPLCTEYNVHTGTYGDGGFWLDGDEEDLGPFRTPADVVAELEEAA
jgi:hypothetical protein